MEGELRGSHGWEGILPSFGSFWRSGTLPFLPRRLSVPGLKLLWQVGETGVACAFVEVERAPSQSLEWQELSGEQLSLQEVVWTPVCPLGLLKVLNVLQNWQELVS